MAPGMLLDHRLIYAQLVENGLDGLPDDVGENIKSSSMGHTEDNGLDSHIDRSVDEGLHTRDERLATLQTESLLVGELGGDEVFEPVGPHQSVENHALLIDRVLPRMRNFDSLSDPVALVSVRDVNVLDSNVAAYKERRAEDATHGQFPRVPQSKAD